MFYRRIDFRKFLFDLVDMNLLGKIIKAMNDIDISIVTSSDWNMSGGAYRARYIGVVGCWCWQ